VTAVSQRRIVDQRKDHQPGSDDQRQADNAPEDDTLGPGVIGNQD
jgi:hypothetical protein